MQEEVKKKLPSYTAPKNIYEDFADDDADTEDPFKDKRRKTIAEKEDDYQSRGRKRFQLSPTRADSLSGAEGRTYREIMEETLLEKEEAELRRKLMKKMEEKEKEAPKEKKKNRWDVKEAVSKKSQWDVVAEKEEKTSAPRSRWDQTPDVSSGSSKWDQTPDIKSGTSQWDQTPDVTRTSGSKWDQTPTTVSGLSTPHIGLATPMLGDDPRNRPYTTEELDDMLPGEDDGYQIINPPESYAPIRTPARKATTAPSPFVSSGYVMPTSNATSDFDVPIDLGDGLPMLKPEDKMFFGKLINLNEDQLSLEEAKEVKIMKLLLKIKNGTPIQRKQALRQITERAREFGPNPLFSQILPLLMSDGLEEQERHLLVKVIDRILYKLDDLVRPYAHKILIVIQPLLIDKDYYARVEAREIISNLSKAAGPVTMIHVLRPDIDKEDEYVRNTTARTFAVVAATLGIPTLLPFLKAACNSKKSWYARHTGIKIIQQIAILIGCAILPHLKNLVDVIVHGLTDEQQKVRTITALAIAALAEAAAPYGIESFDSVLKPLWDGIGKYRGKPLAAFLKAIGCIIPLMEAEYAGHYTKEVMIVLDREFSNPDDDMKKIVLKVVKQCVGTDGVDASYVKRDVLPNFFKYYWVRRMSLDNRNSKQLIETILEITKKVGVTEILERIVDSPKDEAEPFRKMACEAIYSIITEMGATEIDENLEIRLIDSLMYAYQSQLVDETPTVLNAFGAVLDSLGVRAKPYLSQIKDIIIHRLTNQMPRVRQQACDLVSKIAPTMKRCNEDAMMANLGVVLFENLGEEYPEVLGSILGALKAIVNVIGIVNMNPPIKDLLPRLTPILKNRQEKVQENCIDLVGRIADRGADYVSPREWMRVCFELLEMLKAHKKGIRRAAVNTFGYIARAIGPPEVLTTLLNNLRVQERQNRVCTAVAIAIVAETCQPFTVLPALMNEYLLPELNVQTGVLKALTFIFEYIGEMGKDYIYAVTPLLEDALMDRDLVHRQTACTVVKHMSIGVYGLGTEDALTHLLNFVWPNIFETSPHVINAVTEALEGLRVGLGPTPLLQYLMQGLFHPARKVRTAYWKIYNQTYIGAQDGMIPSFPKYPTQDEHCNRPELNMFI